MVHDARQVSVGKSNPPERSGTQNFAWSGFPIFTKEKTRRRIEISVPPAVQNDACNVSPGVEAGAGKHTGKLLANLPFVFAEWSCQHLSAAPVPLIGDRQP